MAAHRLKAQLVVSIFKDTYEHFRSSIITMHIISFRLFTDCTIKKVLKSFENIHECSLEENIRLEANDQIGKNRLL